MKLVSCLFAPSKLEPLKRALWHGGFRSMTVSEAKGYGYQKGRMEPGKEEFIGELTPRIRVEVGVRDADVDAVVDIFVDSIRTGRIGDGKIFVTSLEQVIRVRTGERGEDAI